MLYDATIHYGNKTISFKVPRKYFSGDYTLPDFFKHTRTFELNNQSPEEVADILSIPIDEYQQMENGTHLITKDVLTEFLRYYHIPKKIARLADPQETNEKTELAEKIYQLRTTRGNKTQAEVAEKLHISRTAYAGYESGRNEPDLKTLVKIADLYGVSLDYLAGRY